MQQTWQDEHPGYWSSYLTLTLTTLPHHKMHSHGFSHPLRGGSTYSSWSQILEIQDSYETKRGFLMIATSGGRITMHPLLEHIQVESSCVCRSCAVTPRSVGPAHDTVSKLHQEQPNTFDSPASYIYTATKPTAPTSLPFTERDSQLCMCDRSAEFQPCKSCDWTMTELEPALQRVYTTSFNTISIFSYYPHDPCSECLYCVDEEGDLLHTLAGELYTQGVSIYYFLASFKGGVVT